MSIAIAFEPRPEWKARHPNSTWAPEREEQLRDLWLAGDLSCAQIAAVMGEGLTRNAVIGKVHRMKLAGRKRLRKSYAPKEPRPVKEPKYRRLRAERPRPVVLPELIDRTEAWNALPDTTPIAFMDLTEHTCKWPAGERPFRYCGCPPTAGSPYCAQHKAIAVNAMPVIHSKAAAEGDEQGLNARSSKASGGRFWFGKPTDLHRFTHT